MRRRSNPNFAHGLLAASLATSVVGLFACDAVEKPAPETQAAAASQAASGPQSAPAPAPVPQAVPAPEATVTPVIESNLAAPGANAVPIDRARFPDPLWFTPELLPLSSVKHKGHSAPREDGTFSSSLLLEVEHELAPADCMSTIRGKIEDEVQWAEAKTGDDGRITVRGDAPRYFVTLVCGQIKGKTIASVNYTWTS